MLHRLTWVIIFTAKSQTWSRETKAQPNLASLKSGHFCGWENFCGTWTCNLHGLNCLLWWFVDGSTCDQLKVVRPKSCGHKHELRLTNVFEFLSQPRLAIPSTEVWKSACAPLEGHCALIYSCSCLQVRTRYLTARMDFWCAGNFVTKPL